MIIDTPTGRIIPIFNCAGLQVDAIYEDQFVFASEHITLRGLPESTEGTVHARIGSIGWFEFTGV